MSALDTGLESKSWSAIYLTFLTQGLVLNFDLSEFPEKIPCPESNSENQSQCYLWEVEWCQGRHLGRTFSNVRPHAESPGPPDLLFLCAGRSADITEGPQRPCGPQPAAHSPGRPLPLLPQRVGAILPGVYHHSLWPHTLTLSLPPFTLLLNKSVDPVRFKNSHSTNLYNEGAE